jgi:carboxymethylenebutenolidase
MDEKTSKPSSSPLPNAPCIQVTLEITIQPPLSRRGTGPGLILIVANHLDLNHHAKTLDPPPIQKWAEEGYAVSQICLGETAANLPEKLDTALRELKKLPSCSPVDKVGLVGK